MKSKSIISLLSLLLMAPIFLIMPDVGGAAVWIGGQVGYIFTADGDVKNNVHWRGFDRIKNIKTDPAFIGGVTIGYDFVKEGYLGYDWPNWMKYFSLALDVTYNDYNQPAQDVQAQQLPRKTPKGVVTIKIDEAHGYMVMLSLELIAKYGFFPTPELSFGRLIPYVGIGPGLVFSVVNTKSSFSGYPSSDSMEPAFFTEAGVRYMVSSPCVPGCLISLPLCLSFL